MTWLIGLVVFSAVALAAANGANDNAKGVATLVGGARWPGQRALWLAHAATLAGATASVLLGRALLRAFTGEGLLPQQWVASPEVLACVGGAAALTVAVATTLRLPVSTTHALTGALAGAGLGLAGTVALQPLMSRFVWPLLASPLVSALGAAVAYRTLKRFNDPSARAGQCLCVTDMRPVAAAAAPPGLSARAASATVTLPAVAVGTPEDTLCRPPLVRLRLERTTLLEWAHAGSAAWISAARGLNDTPKLAALLAGTALLGDGSQATGLVAAAMLVGAAASAHRLLPTMSRRITDLGAGSAALANLTAATLVTGASLVALPVSTTHVTCGALFGVGLARGRLRWDVAARIVAAWVLTFPLAFMLAVAMVRMMTGNL